MRVNSIELQKLSGSDLCILREELSGNMADITYILTIEQELDRRIKLVFPDYDRYEDQNKLNTNL